MMPKYLIVLIALSFTALTCLAETKPRAEGRIIIGYFGQSMSEVANRSDVEVSLNFWGRELLAENAKKLNIDVIETKAILFDTMQEMHDATLRGELDVIVGPPFLLAKYYHSNEIVDGFNGLLEDGKPDGLLLVARKDKSIFSIKDLHNKRLLILAGDEMADIFVDGLFLKEFNKSYPQVVGSFQQQSKASRIILDIYFDKADVGVVYRQAYDVMLELNPDIANKTIILGSYPIKSRNFTYFVEGYPYSSELTSIVMDTFKYNVNPKAKQILELFKASTLEPCSVKELEAFDKFYKDYLNLKNKTNKLFR